MVKENNVKIWGFWSRPDCWESIVTFMLQTAHKSAAKIFIVWTWIHFQLDAGVGDIS